MSDTAAADPVAQLIEALRPELAKLVDEAVAKVVPGGTATVAAAEDTAAEDTAAEVAAKVLTPAEDLMARLHLEPVAHVVDTIDSWIGQHFGKPAD